MKVIRGFGHYKCERTIDFSRPLKYYYNPFKPGGKGFGIPVIENLDTPSEVCFWIHETIRATIGKDRYELNVDDPKVYAQLKNNVEILFALHGLR